MLRNPQTGILFYWDSLDECERWRQNNAAAYANGDETLCVESWQGVPATFVIIVQETQRQGLDLSCSANQNSGPFQPWESRDYLFDSFEDQVDPSKENKTSGDYTNNDVCDFVQVQLRFA